MFFRYINGSLILEFFILRLHSLSSGWISPSLGSGTFLGSSARFTRVSETFGPVRDQIPNLGRQARWGAAWAAAWPRAGAWPGRALGRAGARPGRAWAAAWTRLGRVQDESGPRFRKFLGSFLGFFEGFKHDLHGLLLDSKTPILPKS